MAEPGIQKKCPDCAELVQVDARICRFCRFNFETGTSAGGEEPSLAPCSACGAGNPDSATFCNQCGAPTSVEPPERLDFSHFPKPPPVPRGADRGKLADRVLRFGTVQGRTLAEIEQVMGPPYSRELYPPDGLLVKWSQTRMTMRSFADTYHLELVFDANGICGGALKEYHRAL